MRIALLGIIVVGLFHYAELVEDTGAVVKPVAEEAKQLSEHIAPNLVDNENKKRHHFEARHHHKKLRPVPVSNIMGIISPPEFTETTTETLRAGMTNILPNELQSKSDSLNSIEDSGPKFVFSSIHKKLVPKEDEERDEEMLKSLRPAISEGVIGTPELIRDAINPFELHRNPESGSGLFPQISNTFSDTPHPIGPFDSQTGAIDAASNTKPLLRVTVHSKLTVKKINPTTTTTRATTRRPTFTSSESEESGESHEDQSKRVESKKTDEDDPHCPSGSDIVHGTKKLWKGFRKAKSWGKSFKSVGKTAKSAVTSVGSCIKKIWNGFTSMLGFNKKDNKEESRKGRSIDDDEDEFENFEVDEESAQREARSEGGITKAKKGFNKHVSKPVKGFFDDLASKTKFAFSRRSANTDDFVDESAVAEEAEGSQLAI